MNILFFDDLGAFFIFCISVDGFCLDHSANHQKLNIIQKMNILFFNDYLGDLFHFFAFQLTFFVFYLDHSTNHQKLNVIQKHEHFIFQLLGGPFLFFLFTFGQHFCSDHSVNHQKLNVIQK